jgi:hypothetical protein
MAKKVVRDGKVAVLVSYGFGAGWSTWADASLKQEALFNPIFVDWVENGKKEDVNEIVKSVFGDEYFYTGGSDGLAIEWIPVGTGFRITEYDGSEQLETVESVDWSIA